ncbi:hypothetical protein MY3957_008251 [Beauveria namnaoensis]
MNPASSRSTSSSALLKQRSLSPMVRLPDLVRDSKLETRPDPTGDTIHIYRESSRQRGAPEEERWRHKFPIGNGGAGFVSLEEKVTRRATCPVARRAVKAIRVHEPREPKSPNRLSVAEEYVRELEALAKFSQRKYSGCFVQFYGWWQRTEHPRYLYIAMEYCPLGDLESYISSRGPLLADEAQAITAQVLDGLCYMHEEGFAHRDLKPANVLIKSSPPDPWWVVICDHGLSKRVEDAAVLTTIVKGTPMFISPERRGFYRDIVPKTADPYAADMWCLGETTFRILCGESTFSSDDMLRQFARGSLNFPTKSMRNANVGNSAIDFVTSIMHPQPARRLTCFQAREHAWMQVIQTQEPPSPQLQAHALQNLEAGIDPDTPQQQKQPLDDHIPVSQSIAMPTTATQSSLAWSPVTQPLRDITSKALPKVVDPMGALPDFSLVDYIGTTANTTASGLENPTATVTRITQDVSQPSEVLYSLRSAAEFQGPGLNKSGQGTLHEVAKDGLVEMMNQLLKNGADVTSRDDDGWTLVDNAARNGHVEMVKLLLENGANATTPGNNGRTPIHSAASNGHEAVARLLAEKGANIEAKDKDSHTPLSYAAFYGHDAMAKLLVEKGAALEATNKNGRTPLFIAALEGHRAVTRVLVEKGANLGAKDEHGDTPLSCAVYNGHEAVARVLIRNGANIEAKNKDGYTPLSWAAYNGHRSVARLLIKKGANVEAKNKDGRTPLLLAAQNGHMAVERLLLEKGARKSLRYRFSYN